MLEGLLCISLQLCLGFCRPTIHSMLLKSPGSWSRCCGELQKLQTVSTPRFNFAAIFCLVLSPASWFWSCSWKMNWSNRGGNSIGLHFLQISPWVAVVYYRLFMMSTIYADCLCRCWFVKTNPSRCFETQLAEESSKIAANLVVL